jgi:hypothetical protein
MSLMANYNSVKERRTTHQGYVMQTSRENKFLSFLRLHTRTRKVTHAKTGKNGIRYRSFPHSMSTYVHIIPFPSYKMGNDVDFLSVVNEFKSATSLRTHSPAATHTRALLYDLR